MTNDKSNKPNVESSTQKHFGVLSELCNSDKLAIDIERRVPDRSSGEYITTAAESILAREFYVTDIQKVCDRLLENKTISEKIPLGISHLDKALKDGILKDTLTTITAQGDLSTVAFDLPIIQHKFNQVFDVEVARRHLYKDLIRRFNDDIRNSPLQGTVWVIKLERVKGTEKINFMFNLLGDSHRDNNRRKAYSNILSKLTKKYIAEIEAEEAEVMKRE